MINIVSKVLFYSFLLTSIYLHSQSVRVIDNKGTIKDINNNTVTVSTDADAFANIPSTTFPENPLENDMFIYKPTVGEKVYYAFDGTEWNMIAPTKSARIFYPPSVSLPMPTSIPSGGTVTLTYNLYSDYSSQFSLPATTSASSPSAPALPTYAANELWYYVTYFDTNIFDTINIDANGLMTYTVKALPTDDNTIINVVFAVK